MTGIDHPECEYHGYNLYHNANVTMGSIHLDGNNVTSNATAFHLDDFGYYGYSVYNASTFTMGDFTCNDNTLSGGEKGLYQSDFSNLGYRVRDDSHVTIGNHEYNRNNITSRFNGLTIEDHYHWGEQVNGTSTFTRGNLYIVDNTIRTNSTTAGESSGLMFKWLNSWGKYVSEDGGVTHGSVFITGNDVTATDAAINFTRSPFDLIGSRLSENGTVTVGHFYVQNNTLMGNYTIDFDDPDDIGVENINNSVFKFGGIVVSGNTIGSCQRGISIDSCPKIWSNRTGAMNLSFFRVLDNVIDSDRCGIRLGDSLQIEVAFNNCSGGKYGIAVVESNVNDVHDNEIDNCSEIGIWTPWSDHIVVYNNSIRSCGVGIWERSGDYNHFYNNEIDNSTGFGIRVYRSEWCNYTGNIITSSNTASAEYAFGMNRSENCTIVSNLLWYGDMGGIGLWSDCRDIEIVGNLIKRNADTGIYVMNSTRVNITNNTVAKNDLAIGVRYDGSLVNITYNEIFWNTDWAVFLEGNNCTVHHNNFDNNSQSPQAYDEGEDNMWDDGISEGNWWDDWNGTGNYTIDGSSDAADNYPLGDPVETDAPEKVPEFGLLFTITLLFALLVITRRR